MTWDELLEHTDDWVLWGQVSRASGLERRDASRLQLLAQLRVRDCRCYYEGQHNYDYTCEPVGASAALANARAEGECQRDSWYSLWLAWLKTARVEASLPWYENVPAPALPLVYGSGARLSLGTFHPLSLPRWRL